MKLSAKQKKAIEERYKKSLKPFMIEYIATAGDDPRWNEIVSDFITDAVRQDMDKLDLDQDTDLYDYIQELNKILEKVVTSYMKAVKKA